MKMVSFTVDQMQIDAEPGTTLLKACLDNGIYIPHLCYMEHFQPAPASCRMCYVAVQGRQQPVTACTEEVKPGMLVQTDTAEVRRLQKVGLQLLLSVHDVDCRNCPANRNCPLQKMARHLKVALKSKQFDQNLKSPAIDQSHPHLDYHPNRCVLCGKCIEVCRRRNGQPAFTFARRGFDTVIQYFDGGDPDRCDCPPVHECVEACPVAALLPRDGV